MRFSLPNTVSRCQPKKRSSTPRCDICGGTTREGKPLCPNHIEQMPYVQWILGVIGNQDHEQVKVEFTGKTKHIEEDSLTIKELVSLLKVRGRRTVRGLSKEMSLDQEIIDVYVEYLYSRNMVSLTDNRRRTDKIIALTYDPGDKIMPSY